MGEKALAWLRLSLARGIGPISGRQLVCACGSIDALWHLSRDALLSIEGVGPRLAAAIANSRLTDAEQIAEVCRLHDITMICPDDAAYPPQYAQQEDAPLILFAQGDISHLSRAPMLAVVGSRKTSREGSMIARRWSRTFAQHGVSIISGMAYGIDAAAHGGALEGKGGTIAVLGSGLAAKFTPEQQRQIAAIRSQGCVISEYLPTSDARPEHFPRRNRIIAGLSQATLVVEADIQSGSLITARQAAEYGKDVIAVPGSVLAANHAGCHQLIRDGALIGESPEQVMVSLDGPNSRLRKKSMFRPASRRERCYRRWSQAPCMSMHWQKLAG